MCLTPLGSPAHVVILQLAMNVALIAKSRLDHFKRITLGTRFRHRRSAMSMLKTLAVGVVGLLAWQAWQRRKATAPTAAVPDAGDRIPPHGDPVFAGADPDFVPRVAAQSSRGFGEP